MQRIHLVPLSAVLVCLLLVSSAFGVTRVVLGEMFTNTGSPYDPPANAELDRLLSVYGDSLALIRYHTWWPSSGDPFYQYNIPENTAKNNFYSNNYVPHLFLDGTIDAGYSYSTWDSLIQDRWNDDPYLNIGLYGGYDPYSREVDLLVRLSALTYIPPQWDLRILVVLTESNLPYGANPTDLWGNLFFEIAIF